MSDARARLLSALTACADHGRPCPSLPQLGQSMRTSTKTITKLLNGLRAEGKIWWRIEDGQVGNRYRVVTIAATKRSTGEPLPPKRRRKGAAPEARPYSPTPDALTSPGQRLVGEEFARRKRELEAREAEQRRRMEARA